MNWRWHPKSIDADMSLEWKQIIVAEFLLYSIV